MTKHCDRHRMWLFIALIVYFVVFGCCIEKEAYADGNCGDNITYTFHDGTLYLTGSGPMPSYSQSNPAPYKSSLIEQVIIGEGITSISPYAFYCCTSLKEIVIPNTVKSVGSYAFYHCDSLQSIVIPDSVQVIAVGAFQYCTNLKLITIPFIGVSREEKNAYTRVFGSIFGLEWTVNGTTGPVTTKQYYSETQFAFYYIPSTLTSITVTNADEVPFGAFYGCTQIDAIEIYGELTNIGENAFYNCQSLWKANVESSSPYSIDKRAFYGCSRLGTYNFSNVCSIGVSSFSGCKRLSNISFTSELVEIGGGAFCGCQSITSISIPDGITSINASTFASCSTLITVILPQSVESIMENAFGGCTTLAEVTWPSKLYEVGTNAFRECKALETMPPYVEIVGSYAFYECSKIHSTSLSDGMITIGKYAFYNCTLLSATQLPNTLTCISEYAFYGCEKLNTIIIPSRVTSIGEYAFSHCQGLVSVDIQADTLILGTEAFSYCNALQTLRFGCSSLFFGKDAFVCSYFKTIDIVSLQAWLSYSAQDPSSFPNKNRSCVLLVNGVQTDTIIIPQGTEAIRDAAFCGMYNITDVFFPQSLQQVGANAFSSCTKIKTIHIGSIDQWLAIRRGDGTSMPNSGTSLEVSLFVDGVLVTSLDISSLDITSIPEAAFRNCSSITSISWPRTLQIIGNNAFANLSGLSVLHLPPNVVRIEGGAFQGCSRLIDIELPQSLLFLGDIAFRNCYSIRQLTIPNKTTYIGTQALAGCSKLTKLTMPYVTKIGTLFESAWWNQPGSEYQGGDGINNWWKAPASLTTVVLTSGTVIDGFSYFYYLQTVILPPTATEIKSEAFAYCSSLTSMVVPDSVLTIGEGAFEGCNRMKSITLPFIGGGRSYTTGKQSLFGFVFGIDYSNFKDSENEVRQSWGSGTDMGALCLIPASLSSVTITDAANIPWGAFSNCKYIRDISIKGAPKTLNTCAFWNCALYNLELPASITRVCDDAFLKCTVQKLNIHDIDRWFSTDLGNCNSSLGYVGSYQLLCDGTPVTEILLTSDISGVSACRFMGISNLKSVTLPNSVQYFGDYAFANCVQLQNVNIPGNVSYIGVKAFSGCNVLRVTLPDYIDTIGAHSFDGVEEVFCNPGTMTSIQLCSDHHVGDDYHFRPVNHPSYLLSMKNNQLVILQYSGSVSQVIIPTNVACWSSTDHYEALLLPDSLDGNCSFTLSATTVTIPDGVRDAGILQLDSCSSLYLPDSMDTFDGISFVHGDPTIYCIDGSVASIWAEINGYAVSFIREWDSESTLMYNGQTINAECGEPIVLSTDSFVIMPIPSDYKGVFTYSGDGFTITEETIIPTCVGNLTLYVTLDGQLTTQVPIHVYQPIKEIKVNAPSICESGESFTVSVQQILPQDNSGKLTWYIDGKIVYTGTDPNLVIQAPNIDGTDMLICVQATSGARAALTVHVPKDVSAPYLQSPTVEVSQPVQICVDIDGQTYINDPLTYGDFVLSSSSNKCITNLSGVLLATKPGKVSFGIKDYFGKTRYLSVEVQDTQHLLLTHYSDTLPTCTVRGNIECYRCDTCGQYFSVDRVELEEQDIFIPALGHGTLQKNEAVQPTCTQAGNIEYYTCVICGQYLDENGEKLDEESLIISATGHPNWDFYPTQPATCTESGCDAYYECSDCGMVIDADGFPTSLQSLVIPPINHSNRTVTVAHDATCSTAGNTEYYTCMDCGICFDSRGDQIQRNSWVIPAIAHANIYMVPATEATCLANGNTEYWHCPNCDLYFDKDVQPIEANSWIIPPVAHANITYVPAVAATCTIAGNVEYYVCPDCGMFFDENETSIDVDSWILPAIAHTNRYVVPEKAATCTLSGNTRYYVCPDCGLFFDQYMVVLEDDCWIVPPIRHAQKSVVQAVLPTCMNAGNIYYQVCDCCDLHFDLDGQVLEVDSWIVPALGHSSKTFVASQEPSCNAAGNKEYYICDYCGLFFDANNQSIADGSWIIQPIMHANRIRVTATEPTCELPGNVQCFVCEDCGAYLDSSCQVVPEESVIIAARGHFIIEDASKIPENGNPGLTAGYHCQECGAVILAQYEAPAVEMTGVFFMPLATRMICDNAFGGVMAKRIVIPQSVDKIGSEVFANCFALTQIEILAPNVVFEENSFCGIDTKKVFFWAPRGSQTAKWLKEHLFMVVEE